MDDPYEKLRTQLEQEEWPSVYLFKFIVPNKSDLIAQTTALFDEATDLSYQPSKKGTYISISAKEMMMNPESVIDRYREAGKIKGLIAL